MPRKHSTRDNHDVEFNLHISDDGWSDGQVTAAILSDIRRELKKLNESIEAMKQAAALQLRTLVGIRKNTYRRRRKKTT